jgi:tetratricopeptide (TPR) repeat protein
MHLLYLLRADAHIGLGDVLLELGKFENAKNAYKKAIEMKQNASASSRYSQAAHDGFSKVLCKLRDHEGEVEQLRLASGGA